MGQHYYCRFPFKGAAWHSIYAENPDEAAVRMARGSVYGPAEVTVRAARPRTRQPIAGTRGLKDIPTTKTFGGRRYIATGAVFASRADAQRAAKNLRAGTYLARVVGYPQTAYRSWNETGTPDPHRPNRDFWVVYARGRNV